MYLKKCLNCLSFEVRFVYYTTQNNGSTFHHRITRKWFKPIEKLCNKILNYLYKSNQGNYTNNWIERLIWKIRKIRGE